MLPSQSGSNFASQFRLAAFTFVEVIVTIILLILFASLIFPLYWGTTHADMAHETRTAAQQAQLTLLSALPQFTADVQPPYWVNPENFAQRDDQEWKISFWKGKAKEYLVFKKLDDDTLVIKTPKSQFRIPSLPNLTISWWKKEKRVIGLAVSWEENGRKQSLHAAWGGELL
ncbi:MAG: hypothetical protein HKM06_02590 [Spirochaetales bacterium]|nr:hypothetical protein [Spirochaetales bacterium]